jgi:hypothetical protein
MLACTGCGGGLFACQSDEDCMGDVAGMCAAGGACSFPDDECDSGQRYGDHAGEMSGECVPVEGTTSGDAGTGSSASSPTSLDVSSTPDDGADSTDPSADTTSMPLGTSTTDVDPTLVTDTGMDESTTGPIVEDPDLLVWLRFLEPDENGAIANDGVLGGNAICVDDCPEIADGLAEYDGLGDCLAFPHHDELVNTPFTAAAWVYPTEAQQGMFLLGKAVEASSQNTWEIYIAHEPLLGQTLGFEMYAPPDVAIEAGPPAIEQWTHIAGTWDGDVLTLFVDGEVVGEAPNAATTFDEHDVRFGCDDDDGVDVYHFDGSFSDVRIYGRALDSMEIAGLASVAPPDPDAAL